MQQGHPRRKQLDYANHEMKMYNRRRVNGLANALNNTFCAISKTVMQVVNGISKAFNTYRDNKPNVTEYTIDEFMVDSGLNSPKQSSVRQDSIKSNHILTNKEKQQMRQRMEDKVTVG